MAISLHKLKIMSDEKTNTKEETNNPQNHLADVHAGKIKVEAKTEGEKKTSGEESSEESEGDVDGEVEEEGE